MLPYATRCGKKCGANTLFHARFRAKLTFFANKNAGTAKTPAFDGLSAALYYFIALRLVVFWREILQIGYVAQSNYIVFGLR